MKNLLPFFSYKLQVTSYKLRVTNVSPLTSNLTPLTAHRTPQTTHRIPLTSYLIPLVVFCLLLLGTSCKKPCTLEPKEGYKIIGDDKNCYYEILDNPDYPELDGEIKSIDDLKNKLALIEQGAAAGSKITLKLGAPLTLQNEQQREVLFDFGVICKTYKGLITLNMNGYKLVPGQKGMKMYYSEWCVYGKLQMGEGAETAGAKGGGALFEVPENEIPLFLGDGQDGDGMQPGPKNPNGDIEIVNNEELQEAPDKVLSYQGIYDKISVRFINKKNLEIDNGPDVNALERLTIGDVAGLFGFKNGKGKLIPAIDSVHIQNANMVKVLYDNIVNIWASTEMGGKKHFWIANKEQLNLIPNNQVVRILEDNSNTVEWNRAVPNILHIVHDWNVAEEIPDMLYNFWHNDIRLIPADNPNLPTGKQNVVGTDDRFLDYLNEPSGSAQAGVPFRFVAAEDLILGEYFDAETQPVTVPNGARNTKGDFGQGNYSGQKLAASYNKIVQYFVDMGIEYPQNASIKRNQFISIPFNIKTYLEKFTSYSGKPIVHIDVYTQYSEPFNGTGYGFRVRMWRAEGIRAPGLPVINNVTLYFDDPIVVNQIKDFSPSEFQAWLAALGLDGTNCDFIIGEENLPAGKEPYYWQAEQYGKGGQAPKFLSRIR